MNFKYRIFWDSGVWFIWNKEYRQKDNIFNRILRATEDGLIQIVINPLVVAEFAPGKKDSDALFYKYLQNPSFLMVNISRKIGERAREINRELNYIPGADAIHLACAEFAEVSYFHSFDETHILNNANKFSNIGICKPCWPEKEKDTQGQLFILHSKEQNQFLEP